MRVVLDTNVLVRATKNATGPARKVLERLQPPAFNPSASPAMKSSARATSSTLP